MGQSKQWSLWCTNWDIIDLILISSSLSLFNRKRSCHVRCYLMRPAQPLCLITSCMQNGQLICNTCGYVMYIKTFSSGTVFVYIIYMTKSAVALFFSSCSASTERYERRALAVVTHEGHVNWFPHRIFHISCSINVRKFPFDNQTCNMWFGSWTHNEQEIDLHPIFEDGIDLSTFNNDFKVSIIYYILFAI